MAAVALIPTVTQFIKSPFTFHLVLMIGATAAAISGLIGGLIERFRLLAGLAAVSLEALVTIAWLGDSYDDIATISAWIVALLGLAAIIIFWRLAGGMNSSSPSPPIVSGNQLATASVSAPMLRHVKDLWLPFVLAVLGVALVTTAVTAIIAGREAAATVVGILAVVLAFAQLSIMSQQTKLMTRQDELLARAARLTVYGNVAFLDDDLTDIEAQSGVGEGDLAVYRDPALCDKQRLPRNIGLRAFSPPQCRAIYP